MHLWTCRLGCWFACSTPPFCRCICPLINALRSPKKVLLRARIFRDSVRFPSCQHRFSYHYDEWLWRCGEGHAIESAKHAKPCLAKLVGPSGLCRGMQGRRIQWLRTMSNHQIINPTPCTRNGFLFQGFLTQFTQFTPADRPSIGHVDIPSQS